MATERARLHWEGRALRAEKRGTELEPERDGMASNIAGAREILAPFAVHAAEPLIVTAENTVKRLGELATAICAALAEHDEALMVGGSVDFYETRRFLADPNGCKRP